MAASVTRDGQRVSSTREKVHASPTLSLKAVVRQRNAGEQALRDDATLAAFPADSMSCAALAALESEYDFTLVEGLKGGRDPVVEAARKLRHDDLPDTPAHFGKTTPQRKRLANSYDIAACPLPRESAGRMPRPSRRPRLAAQLSGSPSSTIT